MPVLNIPNLTPGDRVQADLLVSDRQEKKPLGGDPFVTLTLSNPTGKIETAPFWPNTMHLIEGVERGSVIQAMGNVSTYDRNGSSKRQLTITTPVRVVPREQANVYSFLPSVGDCTRLWDWIDKARAEMQSQSLRSVVDLFFADDDFRTRFERTPGSVSGHHAKLGGLLLHVYEVTSIAKQIARTTNSRANMDLVITGCLLHDVGKVESYEVAAGGFSHTTCGLLMGHVVLGMLMLERALVKVGKPVCSEGQLLELQHMILSHHGKLEFGSPVQPMTLEAEIVHWADEASSKSNDMSESLDDGEYFTNGGEVSDKKPWRVGRHIWRRSHNWE